VSCSSGAPSRQPPEELSYADRVATGNREIVERGFEAFNEGGVEGILPFIHPDFEATTPPDLASEPDTYRGHEGVRRWFDSFDDVMDEIRWDAHGFREVGDRVVVEFTLRARGKTTGLDFGQDAVMVWELRDGRAIRVSLYPTLDQALSAIDQGSST
jgi:ketosteroid isomerase-like protein